MSESDREWLFEQIDRDNMSNDEFLKAYLTRLLEHYSYENLSGLPEGQLDREFEIVNERFNNLLTEFPNSDNSLMDETTQKVMFDIDFDELTEEQLLEIRLSMRQIDRNLNRAVKDAHNERLQHRTTIGRLIMEFAGKITPGTSQHVEVYPEIDK
ncbi:hypothetical protein KTS45_06830 [Halomicroarcula limicola]|uniref:Uncharacterized protein n=1 Tax=Haloarcula limicola TaxID=1429915 RepID=A0A8J7Y3W3_9EURY|nr:hypothetical protein [Halomicroarcula limicola]MBV0923915.1 hypothetical protein [Halomicroarcula limicola]